MSTHSPISRLALAGAALLGSCDGSGPSNAAPTAAFTVQCVLMECFFSNSSADADGSIEAYDWDFGDHSARVTTQHATHTYTARGQFTVTLSVTDDDGETATATEPADVRVPNSAPTASFTSSCNGLTCQFIDRSFDVGGAVVSHHWTFGDNSAPEFTRDVTHTYHGPAQFTVALTVTDQQGAQGTATAQVAVTSPNVPPSAGFTFSCTDLTCEFTDQSGDVDGSVASYQWSFGDTQSSIEQNPAHTYGTSGVYPVMLTVTDNQGGTGTYSWPVSVTTPAGPIAVFSVTCSGPVCTFTNTSTGVIPLDGAHWDFGDGTTGWEWSPTHTYQVTQPTTFTVTLSVWDWSLASDLASQDITVVP